jgi:predicted nucleotidyltransferase
MSETEKYGLSLNTIQSLKSVFSKHANIERVLLYGSRAKGHFRLGSDIDLTLVGKKLDLKELLKIENEIEELMLPYKVDLSIYHLIENPDVVAHIDRVGIEF